MPNHFVVVAMCTFDNKRLQEAHKEAEDISLDGLIDANFCELLLPMPLVFQQITSGTRYGRHRNKQTGEWFVGDIPQGDQWQFVPLTDAEKTELTAQYGTFDWVEWQHANWGIKWGTYRTCWQQLIGDGYPLLIQFCTPWGPPKPRMMRMIEDYLRATYYLTEFNWIGHDPFDGSVAPIDVEPQLESTLSTERE